jgi:hypothetical protein
MFCLWTRNPDFEWYPGSRRNEQKAALWSRNSVALPRISRPRSEGTPQGALLGRAQSSFECPRDGLDLYWSRVRNL